MARGLAMDVADMSAAAKARARAAGLPEGSTETDTDETLPEPATDAWTDAKAKALADIRSALGSVQVTDREPLFETTGSLFTREYPSAPWLIDGLITRGGIAMLAAEPKSGKTWLAVEVAVAVASGTKVCGEFFAQRGRVAYFFAEDLAVQVRNRVRALAAGRGITVDRLGDLFVCPRGKFLDVTKDEDLAWVVASCRQLGKIDLLVLDPLRDIHSAAEDKSDEMSPVMRRIRLVAELLGCTVAVAHHKSKPNADAAKRRGGQQMRGSGSLHGSTDSGIYFGLSGGDGVQEFQIGVEVEIKGARSAGIFVLDLSVLDDEQGEAIKASWKVTRDNPAETAAKRKCEEDDDDDVVYRCILDHAGRGDLRSATEWRDAIPGVPDHRARRSLDRLRHNGRTVKRKSKVEPVVMGS